MTSIALTNPIAVGPQVWDSLTFRKLQLGDMAAVLKASTLTDLDDVTRLIASLANIPVETACQIDLDDLAPVIETLVEHVGKSAPQPKI